MVLIRIYGDSLALPRLGDGVLPEATYAELLRQRLAAGGTPVTVLNRSRGGATVDQLYRDYLSDCGYVGDAGDQVLVVQCGIVDCAPRPLPRRARVLVGRLPRALREAFIRFLHRRRALLLRVGLEFRYTDPVRYRRVLEGWLRHASAHCARVLVVTIAPTVPQIEERSPGLSASIELFNALIHEAVASVQSPAVHTVDVHQLLHADAELLRCCINGTDGHHITAEGHHLYADEIIVALRRD